MCDRIAILFNEKIIEEETPAEMKRKYDSSDLNGVFNKIFSKKNRKTYQESTEEKTALNLLPEKTNKKENRRDKMSRRRKKII